MVELDKDIHESAQQLGERLVEFAEKIEFDTPQFQATRDWFDLEELQKGRHQENKNIIAHQDDFESRLYWESEARISEQKIALLEHAISQNRTRIRGYSKVYQNIHDGFDDLHFIARQEAEKKFEGDDAGQDSYVEEIGEKTFNKVMDIVNRKTGNS